MRFLLFIVMIAVAYGIAIYTGLYMKKNKK